QNDLMKRSRSRRKAQAVVIVLAGLAATAAGLRWVLTPQAAPPAPRAAAPRPAAPPRAAAPAETPPPQAEWPQEPPYSLLGRVDPALAGPVFSLFTGSTWTQKTATLELAGHFVASDTLTGLCPD